MTNRVDFLHTKPSKLMDLENDAVNGSLPCRSAIPAACSEKCILVLDDDDSFRELVAALLKPHGYSIWHARNAEQATQCVLGSDPVLAIVDYHLPGIDGASWIHKMRTNGRRFPVVFVSASWCDERTFSWLRNILGVSLVLQKPIVPELFLHRIENVLPLNSCEEVECLKSDQVEHLLSMDPLEMLDAIENLLSCPNLDQSRVNELLDLRNSVRSQIDVMKDREQFISDLPGQVVHLVEMAVEAKAACRDTAVIKKAMEVAQQIARSSEFFGFTELSEIAERISGFLSNMGGCCETEVEIFWFEIDNLIVQACRNAELIIEELKQPAVKQTFSLVIVSAQERFGEVMRTLEGQQQITELNSRPAALSYCARAPIDGAIIDLSLDGANDAFQLARELRALPNCQNVPICIIPNKEHSISQSELDYMGCVSMLDDPPTPDVCRYVLERLKCEAFYRKPRILIVDDDPMLCNFIEECLRQHGYNIQILHQPIRILETLEEFSPNLVILDVVMPGLCGYDVCRLIRNQDKWKDLPILFLTAKTGEASRSAAFRAGADDFLAKPISSPELYESVRTKINTEAHSSSNLCLSTGVLEREAFVQRATKLLTDCRASKQPLTAALVSLEDSFQLSVGAEAFLYERSICSLAQILCTRFRHCDLRGRWYRNKFAILFPGLTLAETKDTLGWLVKEWTRPSTATDPESPTCLEALHLSFAEMGPDGESVETLMRCCEARCGRFV